MKHVISWGPGYGPLIRKFSCPCGCIFEADPDSYEVENLEPIMIVRSDCPRCKMEVSLSISA